MNDENKNKNKPYKGLYIRIVCNIGPFLWKGFTGCKAYLT